MIPVVVFLSRLRLVVSIGSVLALPRVVDGPKRRRPVGPLAGYDLSVPIFSGLKPRGRGARGRPYDARQ
jgi:hypothetical protein